ncbi:hypothetical protein L3X38_017814 [Prunus dulcis]|uniref:Uncharacterized protein n=1 Tax=Prunus dulcis TaxID=3755 RepID=A0AAD4ZB30_PRUDU|nr:hypothetical protein L3X38_017814 [Prunus dulcis]
MTSPVLKVTKVAAPHSKSTLAFWQRNNKAEDVADGAAKSINFSSEDHDDVARISKMRYDALIMKIKCLKIRLRWYEETLAKEKKKAKFHLRSVQIMKVRVRLAKRKGV